MSTDGVESSKMMIDPHRRARVGSAIVFVILLATAIIWPRPVLWINEATVGADLPISTVSFLGREAPSWDVVYWGLVGLCVLLMFHGRVANVGPTWSEVTDAMMELRSRTKTELARVRTVRGAIVAILLISLCAITWLILDAPMIAQVSRVGSRSVHDFVRLSNRLGGGGNPPMIVGFFVLGGLAFRRARWVLLGFAMAASAAISGVLASGLKPIVARSRPDYWFGPFSRVWGGESSFPSGHAIAAFAMAGAVFAGSRSRGLRIAALLMALSVASTRFIALRHWPSDILVSAIVGGLLGLFAGRVFVRQTSSARSDVEVGEID